MEKGEKKKKKKDEKDEEIEKRREKPPVWALHLRGTKWAKKPVARAVPMNAFSMGWQTLLYYSRPCRKRSIISSATLTVRSGAAS